MLKDNNITAIKAVSVRPEPGAAGILISILTGTAAAASKEAVKSLYFIASIDDLRALCALAATTNDAA